MKTQPFLPLCLLALLPFFAGAQLSEDGLVLHFSAAAPGKDISGKQNDGAWHNISQGPGIPGISKHSLYFDGSSSYINLPPSTTLDSSKSITLATWFNASAFASSTSRSYLISRRFSDKNAWMALNLFFYAAAFYQTDGLLTEEVAFNEFLQKNQWNHIVGVFDFEKQEMRIYFNGILKKKVETKIHPTVSEKSALYIGAQNVNGHVLDFFEGYLEDVRLYNRALDSSEVLALTHGFTFSKPEAAFEQIDHLEAGRYILSSIDSSGQQEPWEIVEISTQEPFWKRGWFVLLSLSGTFALTFLIAFFYNRHRRQEQAFQFEKVQLLERERFRIAREMHDDIGSGLSAINLLTEIALNKSRDPQLAAEIERIAAAAREVNSRIQDIIWTINFQNDSLASLVHHLERLAFQLLAPSGILLKWDAPEALPAAEISGEKRRAVFLVFKEALHNIVKHAQATQVEVHIALASKRLDIRVRDNGCGFDPANAGDQGNGLINMRKRMEDLGGNFQIRSARAGTELGFSVGY